MNLSAPFIHRPVATTLLMAALLIFGLLGWRRLPVAALPPIEYPVIAVTTTLPGASAALMAASVTTPLESYLGGLPGLQAMSSRSTEATSTITLTFDLARGIDAGAQDVQAAINAAAGDLPPNLPTPPAYHKVNPADPPVLTLALTSASLPPAALSELADTILVPRLSQVLGVGLVSPVGGQTRAVRLQLDPDALAALGLSLEDVRAAVTRASLNAPKGNTQGQQQAYVIGANDQLVDPADYADLVLATSGGAVVRLRDVGRAEDGVEDARTGAWSGPDRAILLEVRGQPGANLIAVADRIRAALPQLRDAVPQAAQLTVLTDTTGIVRAGIADLQRTVLLTIAVVGAVLWLFLRRVAVTAIAAVALPLSLIGAAGVMSLLGLTLDNLSLMALALAAGLVVDDAIVMIENVVRHLEAGLPPVQAALRGARQIGFTVISLTISLIAVFLPLLLMGGIVGRLFRAFGLTLGVAVAVSAVISLTLTPAMCARLLHASDAAEPPDGWFAALRRLYARSLQSALRQPAPTLLFLAATLAATLWLAVAIPKAFLPQQDTAELIGVTEADGDIAFAALARRQAALVERLRHDPAVVGVESALGDGTPNTGRLTIRLRPAPERTESLSAVQTRLQALADALPGLAVFLQPVQQLQLENRISRTQYQVTLQDADPAELTRWSQRLLDALRTRPALRDVASDQPPDGRQATLQVDRARARQLGVSMAAIDDTLYDAFGQRQIAPIYTQSTQYQVVMEVEPRFRRDPAALARLHVGAADGSQVPLSALGRVTTGSVPLAISHVARFPAVTLSFNVAPGHTLGEALADVQAATSAIGLPPGITTSFAGTAGAFQDSLADEPALVLAAIIVVYIVLGVLYESFIHPVTILSTLPGAGAGALAALAVCGLPLDLTALIGIVLLIGIVKKNAIIMIDFALDRERRTGAAPAEAIVEACLLRFRPIMMTTACALFGALPLALGTGPGAELRRAMGIAIVGGLLVSQLLTLYTTPAIYLQFASWSKARRSFLKKEPKNFHDKEFPKQPFLKIKKVFCFFFSKKKRFLS